MAFVLALLTVGCFVLWIGVPVGVMWAAGEITDSSAQHYLIALPGVIVGMVVWGKGLFWLNRLYVRIQLGSDAVTRDPDDELEHDLGPRWIRGPLEPLLVITLVLALAALFVWFFTIAENPSIQVI